MKEKKEKVGAFEMKLKSVLSKNSPCRFGEEERKSESPGPGLSLVEQVEQVFWEEVDGDEKK